MSETRTRTWRTSTKPQLTATIQHGFYDTWFVELTGNGYPDTERLTSPLQADRRLRELVEDGYAIADPDGYCERYDVLTDDAASQYEDGRDSAEGPAAYVGSIPGDSGRGVVVAEFSDYENSYTEESLWMHDGREF